MSSPDVFEERAPLRHLNFAATQRPEVRQPWSHKPSSLNGLLGNSKMVGCKEIRQPFVNPSPTPCQPFANSFPRLSATPRQPFVPTPVQPPRSMDPRHPFRDTGHRFVGLRGSKLRGCLGEGRLELPGQVREFRFFPSYPSFPRENHSSVKCQGKRLEVPDVLLPHIRDQPREQFSPSNPITLVGAHICKPLLKFCANPRAHNSKLVRANCYDNEMA